MRHTFGPLAVLAFTFASASSAHAYTSDKGYDLTVPAGWTLSTTGTMGTDAILYLPPVNGVTPNINVVVLSTDPKDDLTSIGKETVNEFRRVLTAYRLVSQHTVTEAGVRGIETVGAYTMGTGTHLRMDQIILVGKVSEYVFTLTGDPAHTTTYEQAFSAVMKSLSIADETPPSTTKPPTRDM